MKLVFVIKRDGRKEEFNKDKVKVAVDKAWFAVYNEHNDIVSESFADAVAKSINKNDDVSVEIVHENVIRFLTLREPEVGVSYARYYTKRKTKYEMEMDLTSRIKRLVDGDKDILNENANKDSRTFSTKRDLMAGQVAKVEGLKMLPKGVRDAHLRGDIHYHDLDYSPYLPYSNCCLVDLKYMFENGFDMGNAAIGEPNSIQTAVAQTTQIIANVASHQYGGTSLNRIDEVLEPYAMKNYNKHIKEAELYSVPNKEVYAKDKTKKDIYDSMQSLEYEINTLYTANGQTPFTTIGFGLSESWFGREIQKAILNVRINGLGIERKTAIFPKLLFAIKDGLNLNYSDKNYDIKQLALECSSKRMYPDVLNYDTIVRLTGSFKASMGCRSFLQGWIDPETGKEVNDGRMNLGVVTLNLPRIAIQSDGDKGEFWNIFEQRMNVVHEALKSRKESAFRVKPENAPILYKDGAFGHKLNEEDNLPEKMFLNKRATISIGYIGLYEVGALFYGSDWEGNPEAKEFTLDILKRMKEMGLKWSDEEGIWYSVYGTPSESLTDRFCKLDFEKFGSIKDVTDKDYYTNSFHYDIRKNPNPFDKIDFEQDYPVYASGGFIHYVEYPNIKHNIKALESVWDYSYNRIGYLGTNTPIDKCYECGSEAEFKTTAKGFECANCGNNDPEKCDVIRRTCGYLGNPLSRPMVHGRHEEISSRRKHM